jgi:Flp pilus assembly protein TadG
MTRDEFSRNQRGAVSVLFAGAAVPIVGMLGLAIDYTFLNQARTQMALAADTAALSATRLASSEFVQPVTTWQTDAQTNGNQWFVAQLGHLREATNTSNGSNTTVTRNGTAFTAQVAYSGNVNAHFAALFGVPTFYISGTSTATITINAYVNIALMLDNSSSMLIAATTNDINTMQSITACSPESMGSNQSTSAWTGPITPATCPSTYAKTTGVSYTNNPPTAGQAPQTAACGFACHWSTNNQVLSTGKPDYTQWDYYGLSQNPTKYGAVTGFTTPTLRFNVVQSAAQTVMQTMIADEVFTDQFGISVFTFNNSLAKVYPVDGSEAGYDLSTDSGGAQTLTAAITQPVVSNNGDTDFPDSMTTLASDLTAGGDGSSASSPKKNVFIVTDGIQDYGSRQLGTTQGPFSSTAAVAACNAVKAKGISIYVLYTPYTPLPYNPYYVGNIAQYVNTPPSPNAIVTALQACASSTSNYYEADIPSQITTGLNVLLKAAVSAPARISS